MDHERDKVADLCRQVEKYGASQAIGSTKYSKKWTHTEIGQKVKNMEALMDLIHEGKGAELLKQRTEDPDLKEFLSNVPAYMAKIALTHKAAADGNLLDLQWVLHREGLGLAKDSLGRSPLHQAVLHGQYNVVRHLASAYPLSLCSFDSDGRSPLHYAATLSDNGTLYMYLVSLGADENLKDAAGNTPAIYFGNAELLSNQGLIAASDDLEYVDDPSNDTGVDVYDPTTPVPKHRCVIL